MRSFLVSSCGAVFGYFIASLLLHYIPGASEAPDDVKQAIIFLCGFFSHKIVHRINKLTVKASVGGVEVESSGDDK
jgi:hypothetical protein